MWRLFCHYWFDVSERLIVLRDCGISWVFSLIFSISKTRLFKYIENFTTKNCKFSDKNSDISHIKFSAQNIVVLVRTASPRRF